MTYRSTKTYCHDIGLSACFRQYPTDSHCRLLHGYALEVRLEFEASELDHRNWVIDFGCLGPVKAWLQKTFDHKTLVAEDDPQFGSFVQMEKRGLIDMVVVKATGCEAFAKMIHEEVEGWLLRNSYKPRVRLASVEVREHGGNSGMFISE